MTARYVSSGLVFLLVAAVGMSTSIPGQIFIVGPACATARFVSCERVVPTAELATHGLPALRINRMLVDGVVEAPRGAGFTDCEPDYGRDEAAQRAYTEDVARWLA